MIKIPTSFLLLTLLGLSHVSAANENVATCQSISNDLARLACYDTLFAGQDISELNIPSATPPVAAQVTAPSTPVVKQAKRADDTFGAEQVSAAEGDSVLSTTISKIKANPFGIRTLTMSNGHVWRETESSSLRIKVGQEVYIEKGVFSAYYLKVEGNNRDMRVKRIK